MVNRLQGFGTKVGLAGATIHRDTSRLRATRTKGHGRGGSRRKWASRASPQMGLEASMTKGNYAVLVAVDLVLEIECASRREAERIASAASSALLEDGAAVANGKHAGIDAWLTWPTSSRAPELRTMGRADEDGFEAAIPAAIRLSIEAESQAAARVRGEAATRRLTSEYARVVCRDPRIVRAMVCVPGETADPEATLLESLEPGLDVRALSVARSPRRLHG